MNIRALLNEHLEYSSHDECFQDDDYKMNKINFRVKEMFHARAGTVNNELMWTCYVVIDGIEGVNKGTQMRFLSKPYGLPDNYIIDHQTNFVWFKKKKMAEQAAASAALDGLNNELMWACYVVIDGIEGVNRGTQMRFLSKPYGLPDNYIIDHQTNFVG